MFQRWNLGRVLAYYVGVRSLVVSKLTDVLVVLRRDTSSIVLHLDQVQSIILESHLSIRSQCDKFQDIGGLSSMSMLGIGSPIVVAPASRLFSTSSLATEHRSTMTWPD